MISSPGWVCLPKATPGARSTRTWMASRPGALRSCRCRSVRVTPFCCACAPNGAKTAPVTSAAIAAICKFFILVISAPWFEIRHRRPLAADDGDCFACSCGLLLAVLFVDDVVGVPVRPVLIVLAAVALLVFAMGGGRPAERGGEIGRRGERGIVAVDASGQSCGDFLQQPAIAVGIAERGIRTVAAACRIRAAQPDPSK